MPFHLPEKFPHLILQPATPTDEELDRYIAYLEQELRMARYERETRVCQVPADAPVKRRKKRKDEATPDAVQNGVAPERKKSRRHTAGWQTRRGIKPPPPDDVVAAFAEHGTQIAAPDLKLAETSADDPPSPQ